ncbi:helix-turn-helix transcriptional regulator, partial [Ectopseudomonas mendocina]
MRQELAATVGKIIARHRTAMGITQEQLSLALDVDPITISRFERGVSLPSLLTIQRLCEIFGVSFSQFFAEAPNRRRAMASPPPCWPCSRPCPGRSGSSRWKRSCASAACRAGRSVNRGKRCISRKLWEGLQPRRRQRYQGSRLKPLPHHQPYPMACCRFT